MNAQTPIDPYVRPTTALLAHYRWDSAADLAQVAAR